MDGPVVAAIITASVALAVAIGGAVRGTLQAAVERRYERRRTFLIHAQDAMLVLREELAAYGVALHEQVSGAPAAGSTSFVLAVPAAASLRVATARGRLTVARSRLEDATVDRAMARWEPLAQANLIDPEDTQTSAEEAAFNEVNELIRQALRSTRAMVPRTLRARRR